MLRGCCHAGLLSCSWFFAGGVSWITHCKDRSNKRPSAAESLTRPCRRRSVWSCVVALRCAGFFCCAGGAGAFAQPFPLGKGQVQDMTLSASLAMVLSMDFTFCPGRLALTGQLLYGTPLSEGWFLQTASKWTSRCEVNLQGCVVWLAFADAVQMGLRTARSFFNTPLKSGCETTALSRQQMCESASRVVQVKSRTLKQPS